MNQGRVAEAKPETSSEGAEDTAPIPASSPKQKRPKLNKTSSEEECLNKALQFIMNRVPDQFDTFGEYVAMELRSLKSETYQKMLKRAITQSIAQIAELDDLNSGGTCSTKVTEV
jgi:hypothetical protein